MPTSPSPHRGANSPLSGTAANRGRRSVESTAQAAPALRTLWIPLSVLCALAVAAVIVATLPASLAARLLPAAVLAEDFSGTLWHGSAGAVTVAGYQAGALEWRVRPAELLHLRIAADVHWVRHSFVLDGTVMADRSRLWVSDVHGGGPIEDVIDRPPPLQWRGMAEMNVREVQVRKVTVAETGTHLSLESALGDISVANLAARQVADGTDLGGYSLHFANAALAPDSEATAQVTDTGGPLELEATIRLSLAERRGTFSGSVRERTAAPAAVQRLVDGLAQMHARDGQGRLPIDVEFSL